MDRTIYALSNGNTVASEVGPEVTFGHEDKNIRGGYFSDPEDYRSYPHVAGSYKQGESFLQQQYAWGNQGPVMSPNTSDVTKQIGSIEEREQEDMNGDGFIGAPEEDENEVEITSVVYNNLDDYFGRAIYKMTDGSVHLAEQGLSIGDLPYEGYDQLKSKNGSPIETLGVVAVYG